ncbi:MAG: hypothetical protein MHM6MM_002171 [Cercozoa sp. M6MM]
MGAKQSKRREPPEEDDDPQRPAKDLESFLLDDSRTVAAREAMAGALIGLAVGDMCGLPAEGMTSGAAMLYARALRKLTSDLTASLSGDNAHGNSALLPDDLHFHRGYQQGSGDVPIGMAFTCGRTMLASSVEYPLTPQEESIVRAFTLGYPTRYGERGERTVAFGQYSGDTQCTRELLIALILTDRRVRKRLARKRRRRQRHVKHDRTKKELSLNSDDSLDLTELLGRPPPQQTRTADSPQAITPVPEDDDEINLSTRGLVIAKEGYYFEPAKFFARLRWLHRRERFVIKDEGALRLLRVLARKSRKADKRLRVSRALLLDNSPAVRAIAVALFCHGSVRTVRSLARHQALVTHRNELARAGAIVVALVVSLLMASQCGLSQLAQKRGFVLLLLRSLDNHSRTYFGSFLEEVQRCLALPIPAALRKLANLKTTTDDDNNKTDVEPLESERRPTGAIRLPSHIVPYAGVVILRASFYSWPGVQVGVLGTVQFSAFSKRFSGGRVACAVGWRRHYHSVRTYVCIQWSSSRSACRATSLGAATERWR